MILTDDEALFKVKKNSKEVPKWVEVAREQSELLFALIQGTNFKTVLIEQIEFIESVKKASARAKYSRNIVDLYERLSKPISNVFSATGGATKFEIEDKALLSTFLETIGNLRDGKSIKKYVEDSWMEVYKSDPNGLTFMEYSTTTGREFVQPTYKSIFSIRNYVRRGQLTEWVLFDSKDVEDQQGKPAKLWRIVDDKTDRFYLQQGKNFTLLTKENTADTSHLPITFDHPFGEVPAVINSDIVDVQSGLHLSLFHKITELAEEYARDQSIKSLFKKFHGIPIFWKMVTQCPECTGTGKIGNSSPAIRQLATPQGDPADLKGERKAHPIGECQKCDGKGFYHSKDITDAVTIPLPKEGQPAIPSPIAGYITPPIETWKQYNDEAVLMEDLTEDTQWGTHKEKGQQETATARYIDTQPVMNALNKIADVAQFVDLKISQWVLKFINPNADVNVLLIAYGRRYIIDTPDAILDKYTAAKLAGESTVVLDRMFNEYLTAKYSNDPEWLKEELSKASIEPYLHVPLEMVSTILGQKEAQRKIFFKDWWETNREFSISMAPFETKVSKFNSDFEEHLKTLAPEPGPDPITEDTPEQIAERELAGTSHEDENTLHEEENNNK